jgi:hypothetical protein
MRDGGNVLMYIKDNNKGRGSGGLGRRRTKEPNKRY